MPLTTNAMVSASILLIEHATPAFSHLYQGLLYGTECTEPLLVPIPLEYGCKEWQSLDDLYTEAWIKGDQMGRYGGNSLQDLSHFRYTTTHFPSLPDLQLRNAYTFFRSYAPAVNNSLLDRLSDARAIWMGDLLVVKHSDDNKHTMSDITASDIALVDLIIKRQLTMTDCDNWWSKWMAPRFPCDSADDSE